MTKEELNKAASESARRIASRVLSRRIVESRIAHDDEEALLYKLQGFEQSLTDPQLWNKWGSK